MTFTANRMIITTPSADLPITPSTNPITAPSPALVAAPAKRLTENTAWFNRRHKLFGHLFSGRYKALIVDGRGDGSLPTACE